jgi:hypothetical protein
VGVSPETRLIDRFNSEERTSPRWGATSSTAGLPTPSSRRPASAASAEPRKSWRKASADCAAGRAANTASATARREQAPPETAEAGPLEREFHGARGYDRT